MVCGCVVVFMFVLSFHTRVLGITRRSSGLRALFLLSHLDDLDTLKREELGQRYSTPREEGKLGGNGY